MAKGSPHRFDLDSTYFIAFEMSHEALKRGLKAASSLNISQYRLLAKLAQTQEEVNQGDIGKILGMRPNALTQNVSTLEDKGFVSQSIGSDDARFRYICATETGQEHVAQVNASLVKSLYASFPTQDETYRTILEAAISAASQIEPPLNEQRALRYPATRSLLSIDLIRSETQQALRERIGASFYECRIVQKLSELESPERIGVIAEQLLISNVNATRAVNQLAKRGWIRKLKSPLDKKAVYIALTDTGAKQGKIINATINDLAATKLWKHLRPEQKDAIERVGHVVIADINAIKRAKEQASLELLQEI